MQTMRWQDGSLILLDQTRLPQEEVYLTCIDYKTVAKAICLLQVRGAPAIGAAAAYGLLIGAQQLLKENLSVQAFVEKLLQIKQELAQTRPTAVNLFWALNKMTQDLAQADNIETIMDTLTVRAQGIYSEDERSNLLIGEYGATLFEEKCNILTHCNAGALATCGIGTALGVIKCAYNQGKVAMVYADETRPLLQGSRLTASELCAEGIPVTVITDNMAGWVMKNKMVQAVIVGADRIAANGDTANKIGTYSLAVLAKAHNIPMYVAAPISTFDFTIENGEQIPIEQRDAEEVRSLQGVPTAPSGVNVFNPAFDVTPHEYITAIITEYGIISNPDSNKIKEFEQNVYTKKENA